jgi:hypothetical protein
MLSSESSVIISKGGGCYHLWRGLLSSEESVVLSSGMGLLSSGEGGSYHLGIECYHLAIFYSVYIDVLMLSSDVII